MERYPLRVESSKNWMSRAGNGMNRLFFSFYLFIYWLIDFLIYITPITSLGRLLEDQEAGMEHVLIFPDNDQAFLKFYL